MPTRPLFNLMSVVLTTALVAAPSQAYAEPPPEPKASPSAEDLERAKELFENGKGLYSEGSYDAAIAAFKRAYANSGDAVLLYNIALAHDRAGNFEAALEYLGYYRAFAPESEREQLAEKEESLRKRQLRAETSQSDEAKPSSEPDQPERQPETDEAGVPPASDAPLNDSPEPSPTQSKRKVFTTPVWVLTGVAVAGLGVGTGLGVTAMNRRSDADASCGDAGLCSASAKSDTESARKLALGADIAFAVGATAGVVAIALIINNAVKRKKASPSTAMVPVRGGAGLNFRF